MSTPGPISHDLITRALQVGSVGVWCVDLRQWSLICSTTCKTHFGFEEGEEFPYRILESLIHPMDRGRWAQAIATAIRDHTDFDLEYLRPRPDSRFFRGFLSPLKYLVPRPRPSDRHGPDYLLSGH